MSRRFLIGFAIFVILAFTILLSLPKIGIILPEDVVYFHVEKLDAAPQNYFELTWEDLEKFPELREVLKDASKLPPGGSKSYALPQKRGYSLHGYLTGKQGKVGECNYGGRYFSYCFKFEDAFYGALMSTG